jgi:CheY-like chemotaxis protein
LLIPTPKTPKMNPVDYILCVDDDKDDCELLSEAIRNSGYSTAIRFLHSGEEAIAFLIKAEKEKRLPKLLILDVNMPKMNGLEALTEIRKTLPPSVPVLFLTTSPRDNEVTFSENNNAAIMAKPTSANGFHSVVQTIFGSMI